MFKCDPLANSEPLIRRVYAHAAYLVADGRESKDITRDSFERAFRCDDSHGAG